MNADVTMNGLSTELRGRDQRLATGFDTNTTTAVTLHLRSAFQLADLDLWQAQVSSA